MFAGILATPLTVQIMKLLIVSSLSQAGGPFYLLPFLDGQKYFSVKTATWKPEKCSKMYLRTFRMTKIFALL